MSRLSKLGGGKDDDDDNLYDFGGETAAKATRKPSISLLASSKTSPTSANTSSATSTMGNSYLSNYEKKLQSSSSSSPTGGSEKVKKTRGTTGSHRDGNTTSNSSNSNNSKELSKVDNGSSKRNTEDEEELDNEIDEIYHEYTVRRYAVKYEPPTLVIEYISNSTGKKFVRKLKFKSNNKIKDPNVLASQVIESNSDILNKDLIDTDQIVDLISLLFSNLDNNDTSSKSTTNSSITLASAAASSASSSNKNNIKTTDIENSLLKIDLNKASDALVAKAKEIMNVDFEKNRVKPGSADFEYDKRVEFAPATGGSEWDEDD